MRHHALSARERHVPLSGREGELHSDFFQPGIEYLRSETSIGWVYDHQQSRVSGNLEESAQFENEHRLAGEGIRSICVLPMALQGKCIGTLSFVSREPNRYSEQDALFLQEVANQVVLAIRNMQSYDEIANLKGRLEKENVYLREELRAEHNFEEIVGNSPALLKVLRDVEHVAPPIRLYSSMGKREQGRNWWRARFTAAAPEAVAPW